MFDFSWGELVVIGAVALIVIGPKELPGVLRAVGQWTTKIRRMAAEFQSQFQEAMREAEMADLKKEVDSLTDTAKGCTDSLDSIRSISRRRPNGSPRARGRPRRTKPSRRTTPKPRPTQPPSGNRVRHA